MSDQWVSDLDMIYNYNLYLEIIEHKTVFCV